MSRIQQLFHHKNKNILNVYCTAGFPELSSTLNVIKALQANGADIIELGIPYSDPLADGETIQQSNGTALKNGMTLQLLFEQLNDLRKDINIPVILMGYLNPVMQYGFEKFCSDAQRVGIDGLILPDIPPYEFEKEYREIVQRHNLDYIFLVTPETPDDRIKKLDEISTGFLYAVSSSSTTGKRDNDSSKMEPYLSRLQSMNLKNPVLVGFGIKDKESFMRAARYSNGAIIGSAYIKALQADKDIEKTTARFLKSIVE